MTQPLTPEEKEKRKAERRASRNGGNNGDGIGGHTGGSGESRGDNKGNGGITNTNPNGNGVESDGKGGQPDGTSRRNRRQSVADNGGNDGTGNGGSVNSGNTEPGGDSNKVENVAGKTGGVAVLKPNRSVKPTVKSGKDSKGKGSKKAELTDSETLAGLITTLSASYATMSGKRHWEIPEEEAKQIADPASIVLQSIPKKQIEKVNKLLAPISLVIAAATVIGPRVMIDIATMKEAKNHVNQSKAGKDLPGVAGQTSAKSGNSENRLPSVGGPSVGVNVNDEVARLVNGMGESTGSGTFAK